MARNTLDDLQDHLFMELERLNDCEPGSDELESEIDRAKAVAGIAEKVISNANTALNVVRSAHDMGIKMKAMPRMLNGSTAPSPEGE